MRGLTASQIVQVWELGQPLDAHGRAIALLQAVDARDWRAAPRHDVDARLIALRAATFGPTLEARVTCAHCATALEITVSCHALEADPPTSFVATCEACGSTSSCPFDGSEYVWREVAAAAERTLDEVHVLAACYGW